MNYIVDVENRSIIWAMERFGISLNEVVKKNFEDFEEHGVNRDLQVIRFEYYKRNSEKTAKLIQELSKEYSEERENRARYHAIKLDKKDKKGKSVVSIREKELIFNAIEAAKYEANSLTPLMKKNLENRKSHIKIHENFKKIVENQNEQKVNSLMIFKSMSRQKCEIATKSPSGRSKSDKRNCDTAGIDEKLLVFQAKLEKSAALHEKYLKQKRDVAKNLKKSNKANQSADTQDEMLENIIKRQQNLSNIKLKNLQKNQEKWEIYRKFSEIKAKKIAEKKLEKLKELEEKAEILKRKSMNSESFYLTQKQDFVKKISKKSEINRLKDDQALTNVKRIKSLK